MEISDPEEIFDTETFVMEISDPEEIFDTETFVMEISDPEEIFDTETSGVEISNLEISNTKTSGSGLRRDLKRNTYRCRIGLYKIHPDQKEYVEAKANANAESTVAKAGCGIPLPIVELGVSPLFMLSIDEIIDLGFREKNAGNFKEAATHFYQALSQEPKPDLAFYLIIDSYWLWNNLGKRDYAITQLRTYVQKYLPLFNTELRRQFDAWMVKESYSIILK